VPSLARRRALAVLNRLEGKGGTLAEALAREEGREGLDTRERAFLHELVLGSLRRRGWLDHTLGGLSARPLEKTSPPIRNVLRLGAYQLLFLRVPAHAAVSEAVSLARGEEPRAAGFVNAVLRRLQREGAPAEPDSDADPLGWLTTAGSLPPWLAERWSARLGPTAAVARARALLEPPATSFRFNPRVADAEERARKAGLEWRSTGVPGALELTGGHPGTLADEGVLYVQDVGSQLIARLLARPGTAGRLLDACAAPGGKALLLGDVVGDGGRVVAAEVSTRRLRALSLLTTRWGATNVFPIGADARRPPLVGPFDGLLVDAPCSGLGTLGRHPDIRWNLREADIVRQAHRQQEILQAVAPLVRVGGRLVYATCSVEEEENEGVVRPFLESQPGWTPEPPPGWAASFVGGRFVRMDPAVHRGDAFFAAALVRAG
jgi:16S rRNA (cytosine967-C5)-methyltransferase